MIDNTLHLEFQNHIDKTFNKFDVRVKCVKICSYGWGHDLCDEINLTVDYSSEEFDEMMKRLKNIAIEPCWENVQMIHCAIWWKKGFSVRIWLNKKPFWLYSSEDDIPVIPEELLKND